MACGFSSLAMTGTSLPVSGNNLLHHADVGGGAHEGNRDRVDAVLQAELEIFTVFLGQRRNGERDSGKIDALVLAQNSAINHVALDVGSANLRDPQFDQPIRKQNARARLHLASKILKRCRDQLAVPGTSRGVIVTRAPVCSMTGTWFFSRPVRIFGPCRSCRMQTVRPSLAAARRNR